MPVSSPALPADAGSFSELGLPEPLLRALADVGYETPSPIQAATIPALLAGRDMLGQAQTGTGKTAAFALPILARLDLKRYGPQALILTPTRELAIQVAEAFHSYARHLPGFHVLPIYGGQAYGPQLGGLRRGAHVVVGTPGRVIDHLNRGTLDLRNLSCLVLDEGDEMLRMGFIDDVESVLTRSPPGRQIALFSATMPAEIRRIAKKHLSDPAEITIKNRTSTAANTRQRYWMVSGMQKLDALTRILEVEPFDGMIIFARTKIATDELAQRLEARGFAAAALNGDMAQAQRERTIARLKSGDLDILVATDVAARGLDVDRISHVVNFDIPYDTEAYIHRIGRTGRAGRKGEAILFVSNREQHLLRSIERATRQPIEPMALPSVSAVNDQRIMRFKQKITAALASPQAATYRQIIEQYEIEHGTPARDIAAALACIAQGDSPLLVAEPVRAERAPRPAPPARQNRPERAASSPLERARRPDSGPPDKRAPRSQAPVRPGMVRYRLAVGHQHGVKPGNIVGAIANEAGLENQYIGRVDIRDDHSLIDLPEGMPREILSHLKTVRVVGQQLQIRPDGSPFAGGAPEGRDKPRKKGKLGKPVRKT
ncbi:MAG: DEAD/DEAH box helicase [Gammaproteobacteria bacterium]|nr:DEAD/DEAH box helicase [Gammaproteobacteria bacterium]MCP5139184.1 DEAD/DEAH box helicase [Chromatiales bacterium]